MGASLGRTKEDRRKNGESIDIPFLILTLLLLGIGLVMLYSASSAQSMYDTGYAISTRYLQKQAFCAVIGLGAMWLFSRIPVAVWHRLAWVLYGVSIVLLLLVFSQPLQQLYHFLILVFLFLFVHLIHLNLLLIFVVLVFWHFYS